jgi:hypothetical protein
MTAITESDRSTVKRRSLLKTNKTDCGDSPELFFDSASMRCAPTRTGDCQPWLNEKANHQKSKRIKGTKARGKVKKISKPARSKAVAKPVAKAKPKRAPVKKNAQPAPAVEAVRVEAIEQPAPGAIPAS